MEIRDSVSCEQFNLYPAQFETENSLVTWKNLLLHTLKQGTRYVGFTLL